MSASASILRSLGLDRLLAGDSPGGPPAGRTVLASPEMIRAFHRVFEGERAGAWRSTMKAAGYAAGRKFGAGRLQIDLTDAAEHGLVVARLEHSVFVEALTGAADFVDALPAGMLQGFFEYISGQTLACEEIACVRRGAPLCTFVITAPERLARIMPSLGRENADTLLARLRG